MTFPAENIRDWVGLPVVDVAEDKVGTLEAVYFDTSSDEPAFGTIKVGMLGKHRLVFAPLAGAVVTPKHLKVTPAKKMIKDAPSIDVDGELTSEEEPQVYAHYGLTYRPGATGERRLGRR
ncbi:PRC-barrel domain-containing protein [Labedaea rhizosphaerae]|uniref:PRC-barrel domain protein n=1 Tax=Labedaea rhizosphaerae TaxID=598644 RepID=A0A4V3CZT4_LABRH|nr:PRC-barrel domain-containing protein [Labedaea rhizosphaerae]TDQ00981.1 PRC-barrel domain protein [Labedaea rhizosphaerae]